MQPTTHGQIWQNRKRRDVVGGRLTTVKVGSGTKAESESDTELAGKVYSSTTAAGDVSAVESADGTKTTYFIELQGGQNVAIDETITEIAICVSGTAADGTPVDFGDLDQYTDPDGDLMHTRDTKPQTTVAEGSRPRIALTISARYQ